jgi:hypothetical protein
MPKHSNFYLFVIFMLATWTNLGILFHAFTQLKPHGENLQNVRDVVLYLQRSMNQPHAPYEGAHNDVKWVF